MIQANPLNILLAYKIMETEKPLLTIDTTPIIDNALAILKSVYEIDNEENYYEYNMSVNAGEVADIIELFLLFVERYEDVDIKSLIGVEFSDSVHFIKNSNVQ